MGVSHWDIVNTTIPNTLGMTGQVNLSCAPITTDGTTVTLGAIETVTGTSYSGTGNRRNATCPAGQVAFRFYGRDRISNDGGARWASQVGIACRPVVLVPGDWIELDAAVPVNRQDAGVVENNGAHSSKGPFCDTYDVVAGYERQYGGRGYDGIKARCANFSQARHSAHLAFNNFAWDQTVGGAGWLVDLTRNGAAMAGGTGKLPYSAVPNNNTSEFQDPQELYVYDGANYGATAGQRPSGIDPKTYVELGTCSEGRSLALRQDDTCSLTVAGLPDIAVTASPTSAVFTGYDEPQTLTMTATNYGPGATGTDGYTMIATLPSGWSVNGALPADCVESGQVVTCALDPSPLSGSANPGAAGGTKSFDIPVAVDHPTPGGSQNFTVALGRAAPDGDGNPANVDFETSNDSVAGTFDFQPAPASVAEPNKTVTDANGNGIAEPGEQLTYKITLTNNGAVDATNVDIVDNLDPNTTHLSSDNGGTHTGASPGGTVTWSNLTVPAKIGSVPGVLELTTIVRVIDPLPLGAKISNAAHESGATPPDCSANPLPVSCAVLPVSASLAVETIGVLNDLNGNSRPDVGETISYQYNVVNTGGLDVDDISITDPNLSISGGPISLAAGESNSTAFSAEHTLTAEDIDSGEFEIHPVARGTASDGKILSDLSDDPSDPTNVDLEADGEPDDPTIIRLAQTSDYDLVKKAEHVDTNGNGFADEGEVINYTFTADNTGNVTLTDIEVTDDKAEITGSPIASLPAGRSDSSVKGKHVITQADIDEGSFSNTATAVGKNPKGEDVTKEARPPDGNPGDPTVISFPTNPAVELELVSEWTDTNGNGFPDPGEPVVYSFLVRNTGNVTLENLSIASLDLETAGGGVPAKTIPVPNGTIASLAPSDEHDSLPSVSYPLTQTDIDAGGIVAKTSVNGQARDGTPVTDASDDPVETADVDTEDDGEPDDPTPTPLPQIAALGLEKTGVFQVEGRLAEPGDTILYTLTAINEGNVTTSNVTPADPGPWFGGLPGSGSLSSFSPPSADLGAGENAEFTATYTVTQADIDAAQGLEDGIKNSATVSGFGPEGQPVLSPVAEAAVDLPGYAISKMTPLAEVRRGGRVPYTINVKMLGSVGESAVNIIDMTPSGLTFVRGTAMLDGSAVEPKVDGRKLTFENVTLPTDEAIVIELDLAVTGAAKPGEYVNQAWVETPDGTMVSRVATAVVEVVVEALFDCGDILGKVFDDRNRNGYQDKGEPGLPGVRVATVKGLLLTADDHGRFHVACADLPDQRIGTSYIMKLDSRSLPSGYRLTTENPRVVRLTAGKASEFLFGASIGRVVRLDLTDAAFVEGTQELLPEWEERIMKMIVLLDQEPSVLRLVYSGSEGSKRSAQKRLREIRRKIAAEWRKTGRGYRLEIETRLGTEATARSKQMRAFERK